MSVTYPAEVLDGVACAWCGRSFLDAVPVPSIPVEIVDGGQVFACRPCVDSAREVEPRAAWQVRSCPLWCVESHNDADHPDDRQHVSATAKVELLTEPFTPVPGREGEYAPVTLMADLWQADTEREPRVNLGDAADGFNLRMTLDEAERLAGHLLGLVAEARKDDTR